MDEGDMYEAEVITFVAPKKSGWLRKKNNRELSQPLVHSVLYCLGYRMITHQNVTVRVWIG